MDLLNDNFDVISSFHTLEHVYDPLELFQAFYKKLNFNGKIIIEVPDITKVIQDNVIYSFFPQHVTYFTKEHLVSFAEKTGFEVVQIYNSGTSAVLVAQKNKGGMTPHIQEKFDMNKNTSAFKSNLQKISLKLETEITDPFQFVGTGGSLTCLFSHFNWLTEYSEDFFDKDNKKTNFVVPFTNKLVKPIKLIDLNKNIFL